MAIDLKLQDFFELILAGAGDKEVLDTVKSDEEMLASVTAYCAQCGNCCNSRCGNKSVKDSKTYCDLHPTEGDDYPGDKKIASYDDIYNKLDPNIWAKPSVCHTYGPHTVALALIHYHNIVDRAGFSNASNSCQGANGLYGDYLAFAEEN